MTNGLIVTHTLLDEAITIIAVNSEENFSTVMKDRSLEKVEISLDTR